MEIAIAISEVADVEGFALAGGAALIALGVVERITRDLDYFTTSAPAVNHMNPIVESSLQSRGFAVTRIREAAGFVRLDVRRGDQSCEVDLAHDVRLWPAQDAPIGKILSLEELAADKTLALFGRAAARDYIDVRALSKRFGLPRLCELAAKKDRGFDPSVLAEALTAIDRLSPESFDLSKRELAELRRWAAESARELGVRSLEMRLDRQRDRDTDLELGF